MKYRLPAEWEKHDATWLTWPQNTDTWHTGSILDAQRAFLHFINIIQKGERVNLFVNDVRTEFEVRILADYLSIDLYGVVFYVVKTNDAWIRDYGPDFLVADDELKVLDWKYNAWGGKYPPFDADNNIPTYIANDLELEKESIDFVLEGGSFETNGNGILLTTKSCLLNENRNPRYSQEQIEVLLKEKLCQESVIWLEEGVAGDDTDGHVDDFTRFVSRNQLVTAVETRSANINHEVLKNNLQHLNELKSSYGFDVAEIPMPQHDVLFEGELLPASYLNFYMCNKAVIVPVFDDPNDKIAIDILSSLVTDREVIGINARDIVIGLGGFHCLSKHQPSIVNK